MKTILFDFDGVLVHTHVVCYEIHKELNPNIKYDFFQSLSFGNFQELIEKAKTENKIIVGNDFGKLYKGRLSSLETPEELKKVVVKLSAKYPLFIVSSADSNWISPFLEKESIADKFKKILGSDVHFSKTEKIKNLLIEYKLSPQDVVFVTDTTGDIMEARECEVKSIGVTWGLHEREILAKERPFALVDTPEELERKIEEFFK
ncbi:MAG: HAD-IA family hydrolase [bacterium]